MAVKIYTPKPFTGKAFGVRFVQGVGITDDTSAIRYAQRHGYRVEPVLDTLPEASEAPSAPSDPSGAAETLEASSRPHPLSEYSVPELREYAKEHGISLTGRRTKADILVTILAHEATQVATEDASA